MNKLTKTALSVAIFGVAAGLTGVFSPAVGLASNPAVVGQMASSDQASLWAGYAGHAAQWVDGLVWVGALAAVVIVWLPKRH